MTQLKRKNSIKVIAAAIIIAVMFLVWVISGGIRFGANGHSEDSARAIREAVMNRAMQCYVIEGAYPESLEYLQDNYGLAVNTDDYQIIYIAYAENLPPEIKIVSAK